MRYSNVADKLARLTFKRYMKNSNNCTRIFGVCGHWLPWYSSYLQLKKKISKDIKRCYDGDIVYEYTPYKLLRYI